MALPNIDINAGTPPLLWSSVQEAFEKINENFTALDLATGGTAVDLSNLFTDIIPATTQTYQLGDQTHRWKSVHTGSWSEIPGQELNGLWAGAAQIKGYQSVDENDNPIWIVDLPLGSRVNGDLIIDPDKTFFKAAQVDNSLRIEANEFSDTINLNSGTAIQLVVDSSSESITVNNTGVTSAVAGLGISVSSATGAVTVTNNGVRSLQSVTGLPSGRATGAGINISGSTGDNIRITNTGVLEVQQGFGITVSTDVATGIATVSFNSGVAPQTAFTTIAIAGDSPANNIQSDSTADTLTFSQGYGILLTNNPSTDTMTIALNQRVDIIGSVFGDDSSVLVDGVNNYIYGNVLATTLRSIDAEVGIGAGAGGGGDGIQGSESVAIGANAGAFTQGSYSVAIGSGAGNINQGNYAVAIGATSGAVQGNYAVAIGSSAGYPNSAAGSIAINGSGFNLDAPAAGFYVNPIRSTTSSARPLVYNTTTKEIFYTSTLEFVNSTISTTDSSGIIFDVQTTFNTDVTMENDLNVTQQLRVQGSRVINLTELKSVVAASTSFADFQAKIAALV